MTAPNETAFRALLRWYPRAWRERNEAVVLGTMLDDAAARGIENPDGSLRRTAIIEGLGARLGRRVAIVAASVAVAIAVMGIPLMFLGVGAVWLVLGFGIGPLLILIAIVCTLRTRGMVSAAEALTGIALIIPTTVLSTLAALSWSVGFDEADAGITRGWFGQALVWFAAAAWLATTAWGAVVLGGTFRSGGMRTAWARLAGGVGAAIAYPFLTVSLLSPATGALCAIATLGVVVLATRTPAAPVAAPLTAPEASPDVPQMPARRRPANPAVLLCAVASAVLGIGAILFALTGSGWPGSTWDGTEAMRFGIVAGFVAALPYCATIGLTRSTHHRPLHAWGPASLVAAAFVIVAVENVVGGGDGNGIVWALMIAGLPLGGAVTWILATGRWATRPVQTTLAIMCGAAVMVCAVSIQMLPFLLPIAALVLAISEARRVNAHPPRPATS